MLFYVFNVLNKPEKKLAFVMQVLEICPNLKVNKMRLEVYVDSQQKESALVLRTIAIKKINAKSILKGVVCMKCSLLYKAKRRQL